jgi:hypothetical protein
LDDLLVRVKKRSFTSKGFTELCSCNSGSLYDFVRTKFNTGANDNNSLGNLSDFEILSNNTFNYYSIESTANLKSSGIIFLFHGLNEKRWTKYFPWAYELARRTGKMVILFPLAFHMNRAPASWSDSRLMNKIAVQRANNLPNSQSSFINAAISERLEGRPEKFFLSGMQTYKDFCSLVNSIRQGLEKDITPDATIDFFGYSIGAFFSLLLLMDNPNNEFDNSRLALFCGGATFNYMMPVSRYIIDMRAFKSLEYYFNQQLINKSVMEKNLEYYFNDLKIENSYFPVLINKHHYKELREKRLLHLHERISAIALAKDKVSPPLGVSETLRGSNGNIKTRIEVMDFEYPYDHVTPFSSDERYGIQVDKSFKDIMESYSTFLA